MSQSYLPEMRAVIQRVKQSSVTMKEKIILKIGEGLLVLLGIENADNDEDIDGFQEKS